MRPFTRLSLSCALLLLTACPDDDGDPPGAVDAAAVDAALPAATGVGSISIQDRTLHGLPQAGHGLSVLIDFTTPPRAPDFDEMPGSPAGCKVWMYDVGGANDLPPAPLGDVGVVNIAGTSAPFPRGCRFEAGAGYLCPAVTGSGQANMRHGRAGDADVPAGAAAFDLAGASFGPDDRGRYLEVSGDPAGAGNGRHPILRVLGPTALLVPAAAAPDGAPFAASYRTLAGAGPVPGQPEELPGDHLRDGDRVTVAITPGGAGDFRFPTTAAIPAGASFTLDTASDRTIAALPLDGSPFAIGCGGAGGRCGPADVSILRILTTDGAVAGASPFAMPAAARKQVEIACATVGGDGVVAVPAQVSRYLRAAHEAGPITRIRTAFMRNGYAPPTNPPPLPPNPVRVVVGHQVLAFQNP